MNNQVYFKDSYKTRGKLPKRSKPITKEELTKLQKRFTDAGHTTVIQKYFGPQSILYRVQVYVGKTLGNAERAEKALQGYGYAGSFIIAR